MLVMSVTQQRLAWALRTLWLWAFVLLLTAISWLYLAPQPMELNVASVGGVVLGQGVCCALFGPLTRKIFGWRQRHSVRLVPEVKAERERMARDLHDGVGTHIQHCLAALRTPQCSRQLLHISLEHAAWSLREHLQGLDDVSSTLLQRLAAMRWQMAPLLQAQGVQLQWSMPIQECDKSPQGEQARELALLAQEAISNALRHSRCTQLVVQMHIGPECMLRIADNGQGWDPVLGPASKGRGLRHLRERAQAAGAKLQLQTALGQGCSIELFWSGIAS